MADRWNVNAKRCVTLFTMPESFQLMPDIEQSRAPFDKCFEQNTRESRASSNRITTFIHSLGLTRKKILNKCKFFMRRNYEVIAKLRGHAICLFISPPFASLLRWLFAHEFQAQMICDLRAQQWKSTPEKNGCFTALLHESAVSLFALLAFSRIVFVKSMNFKVSAGRCTINS